MTAMTARLRELLARLAGDPQHRGAGMLLANTVLLSGFGFVFWTIAARLYPSEDVGSFSAVAATVMLLSVVAALGLPNTVMRHLPASEAARRLVAALLGTVTLLGGVVAILVVVVVGPLLPDAVVPRAGGWLLAALVVLTAAGTVTDAALITSRATGVLLVKNLVASVAKVAALIPLSALGSTGLVLAYGVGVALSAVLGLETLWRRLGPARSAASGLALLRQYARFSGGSYLGTVFGIMPLACVPIIVLAARGPREAAWWSVAAMLVGFLNFIPSTTSQVLFAEASREPGRLREQTVKAVRGIYALLLPAMLVLILAAPLVLLAFGGEYRDHATDVLRVLALGTVFTGGTYVVDSILVARDRVRAYVAMNAINAVLVLGAVAVLLPSGLVAGAVGWAVAQGVSLAIGGVVLAAAGLTPRVPARQAERARTPAEREAARKAREERRRGRAGGGASPSMPRRRGGSPAPRAVATSSRR
jgi:O-antigen/teichoic acid export membrane protein